MNPEKQIKKILRCNSKAQSCTSRQEAKKILRKHGKASHKLEEHRHTSNGSDHGYLGTGNV